MTNAILPSSISRVIIGIRIRDPFVYLSESETFIWSPENSHTNKHSVAVRRLRTVVDQCSKLFCLRRRLLRIWLLLLQRSALLNGSSFHEATLVLLLLP